MEFKAKINWKYYYSLPIGEKRDKPEIDKIKEYLKENDYIIVKDEITYMSYHGCDAPLKPVPNIEFYPVEPDVKIHFYKDDLIFPEELNSKENLEELDRLIKWKWSEVKRLC